MIGKKYNLLVNHPNPITIIIEADENFDNFKVSGPKFLSFDNWQKVALQIRLMKKEHELRKHMYEDID